MTPREPSRRISRRTLLRTGVAGAGALKLLGLAGLGLSQAATPRPAAAAAISPGPARAEGARQSGGRITVAISADIKGFDPAAAPDITTQNVGWSILEPMCVLDADGNVQPLLAESWRNIEDVTWEFKLRDASFTNGEPVTAQHVKFSLEHGMEPNAANKATLSTISKMDVVDDKTVRLTTKAPDPILLKRMASGPAAVLPMKYIQEKGWDEFARNPVGTGPFQFVEWVKDSRIAFKANPNYWGGPQKASELVWRPIPESASRVAALQAGEVDVVVRIPPAQVAGLMGSRSFDIVKVLSTRTYYIALDNMKDTPLKDARVRRAINHAVDVDSIIQNIYLGYAERTNSIIGNVQFGHDASVPPMKYDPDLAKQLLREAGYGSGFKTTISSPNGAYSNDKEVCQAVAGFLQDVGIDADVKVYEAVNFWDLEAKRQLSEMFFDGVGDRNYDAAGPLKGVVHQSSVWSVYNNPEVDKLIEAGESTTNQEERLRIYAQLTRMLQEDPAFLYLFQLYDFYGVSKRLQNFQPRGNDLLLFHGVGAAQ